MRLRLVLRDKCYQDALVEMFGRADQDIFTEIGDSFATERKMMIVTDMCEEDIADDDLNECGKGLVLLTDEDTEPYSGEDGPFHLFKFKNIDSLLADIRLFYFMWTGETSAEGFECRTISVFCDSDENKSRTFATALARQTAYRSGKETLLMSLKHIDMREGACDNEERFKRLMYYIEIGRRFPREAFFLTDSYGVSRMRMSGGRNRLQMLSEEEFVGLIAYLADKCFGTIVFDVGTALTDKGIRVINESDPCFFLKSEVYDACSEERLIKEIVKDDDALRRLEMIDVGTDDEMLEFIADEHVSRIFGEDEEMQ